VKLDIDSLAQPIVDVYNGLESDLLNSIARRLRDSGNQADATTKWQIKKLAEMGGLTKENIKIIADATGTVPEMTMIALETAANEAIKEIEPIFQQAAKDNLIRKAIDIEISPAVKNVLASYTKQAIDKMNLTNTTMLHKAQQAYVDIINKTTYAAASGAISRQQALKQTIEEFADKGLPALVDKAGRTWTPEAYTGMVIKTTVHNTAIAAQDARMSDYGVDVFEVSSVSAARPLCAPYQGKLLSSNGAGTTTDVDGHKIHYGALSDTSYGEPAGLFGINCHHTKYPFIAGASAKTYQPTVDEAENAEQYKQSQQQRSIERDIRTAKRKSDMLNSAGLDASNANSKVKAAQTRMRAFVDKTGRTRRPDRERVIK